MYTLMFHNVAFIFVLNYFAKMVHYTQSCTLLTDNLITVRRDSFCSNIPFKILNNQHDFILFK